MATKVNGELVEFDGYEWGCPDDDDTDEIIPCCCGKPRYFRATYAGQWVKAN
jgi:hypothetical protein